MVEKVNHQAGVLTSDTNETKQTNFDKKKWETYFALRVIQFGESVQLDVACP